MLRVYNTLSKSKEDFVPVEPGRVGIYLCGPTVYKPSHIGHMVGPTIFDAIKRYLAYRGFKVTLVINVTDVDDKLIAESQRRGISMQAVAQEMTADYMQNLAAMGIDTVDHFPKATDHIGDIIEFCSALIEQGYAYASEGDVYFDVTKDAEYGKLSNRRPDDMVGEGGSTAERKRHAADFALWKRAKPGEPAWPSPWGEGRPGWHIECSAMSRRLLGETFDIHGGGLDLVFPHHENEVAQSECRHGKPQAKYWLHNGLMQASSEVGKLGGRSTRPADAPGLEGDQAAQEAGKIGKSKGSSAFSELLKKFPGETIRFFLLSTHYRSPIDYSEERIQTIETGLQTFYRFFQRFERLTGRDFYAIPFATGSGARPPLEHPLGQTLAPHRDRFVEFMDDDFNTGAGVAELFEMVRALNRYCETEKLDEPAQRTPERIVSLVEGAQVLREVSATLGLFLRRAAEESASADEGLVGKLMELILELRAEARKTKNFATADKIRNALTAASVVLEDRADGTTWSVKR